MTINRNIFIEVVRFIEISFLRPLVSIFYSHGHRRTGTTSAAAPQSKPTLPRLPPERKPQYPKPPQSPRRGNTKPLRHFIFGFGFGGGAGAGKTKAEAKGSTPRVKPPWAPRGPFFVFFYQCSCPFPGLYPYPYPYPYSAHFFSPLPLPPLPPPSSAAAPEAFIPIPYFSFPLPWPFPFPFPFLSPKISGGACSTRGSRRGPFLCFFFYTSLYIRWFISISISISSSHFFPGFRFLRFLRFLRFRGFLRFLRLPRL